MPQSNNDGPLFSLCFTGRNDNYDGGKFVVRLSKTINFIVYQFERLQALDEIEVVIADWGSEAEPLSAVVLLSESAATATRFVVVPPEVTKKHNFAGIQNYVAIFICLVARLV